MATKREETYDDAKALAVANDALKSLNPESLDRLSNILARPEPEVKSENSEDSSKSHLLSIANWISKTVNNARIKSQAAPEVKTSHVDLACEFLSDIWRADKFLQLIAFGKIAVADVLERYTKHKAVAKIVLDVGFSALNHRALLRFWLFLYQIQKLRTTPRDKQICQIKEKLSKMSEEGECGSRALELNETLSHLQRCRFASKLQAYINLFFQPLDMIGWVSRSSTVISEETTNLIDRGACLCWSFVESLELLISWQEFKYNLKRLKARKPADKEGKAKFEEVLRRLKKRFYWTLVVRLLNIILALNWTVRKPFLNNTFIGAFGFTQTAIDMTLLLTN